MSSVRLNSDQEAALTAVQRGENIFLSGPAGSGKSTLIHAIVEWAARVDKVCQVTALTGCAALLLGSKAKTLHSWAGIGLGRDSVDILVNTIKRSPYAKKRWKSVHMLVIDEISMMTPELFDKLDAVAKAIRGNARPWGGIQLILAGDFFQLPPVAKGYTSDVGRFAFDSVAWKQGALTPVLLTRIERQTDSTFQTVLNEARVGALSPESIAILESRRNLNWKERAIRPTLLFSKNADVDSINESNLAALKKPIHSFDATTSIERVEGHETPTGELLERLVTRLDNDSSYCPKLDLCDGCQVMLVYNKDLEAGLVNGSRGVLVGFRNTDRYPIVQFLHGDPVVIDPVEWKSNDSPCVKRIQFPLRVAYAVTIHKSQGATLDCALVDIGTSTFECGQAYVALSRVRDLESLYVWNFNPSRVMADSRVVEFYASLAEPLTPPTSPPPPPPTPTSYDLASTESCECTNECANIPSALSNIDSSWLPVVKEWWKEGGDRVWGQVSEARRTSKVYPAESDVFQALQIPLHSVRVVILAQDPYHGESQAMGLAFSVRKGVKLPPSLKNIRKELLSDLSLSEDAWKPDVGDLTPWVSQGVLLLNASLTVEDGKPLSHADLGWNSLTYKLLRAVLQNPHVVFLVWGKFAETTVKHQRLEPGHKVLTAAHPSPLSANKGFFGSRPFSQTNTFLVEKGLDPILWTL